MPSHFGRLPRMVGIPAGGSLTADQWLLLATVVAPLAVRNPTAFTWCSYSCSFPKIPRIWEAHMGDPGEARASRAAAIQSRQAKADRLAEGKAQARAAKKAGKDVAVALKKAQKDAAAAMKSTSKDARKAAKNGVALALPAGALGPTETTMSAAPPTFTGGSVVFSAISAGASTRPSSEAIADAVSAATPTPAAPKAVTSTMSTIPRIGKRKRQEADDDEEGDDLPATLHPDDPANFLKLCEAIRVLLAPSLTDMDIDKGDDLLRSYCTELITVSTYSLSAQASTDERRLAVRPRCHQAKSPLCDSYGGKHSGLRAALWILDVLV